MVLGVNPFRAITAIESRLGSANCLSTVLCLLGATLLFVYGIKSYSAGLTAYAGALFAFGLGGLLCYVLYRINRNWIAFRNYISVLFSGLYLFLLASGGEEDTGLMWCYSYPLLMFALVGPRIGKILLAGMLLLSGVILYFPDLVWATHGYSDNVKYRFTGSILFVSLMAYLSENARMIARQESEKAHENLRQIARLDELTGVYNRRGIKQKVQLELHRVARDRKEMSLVLCDLDLFKTINDRFGHDVGDLALKHVSKRLSESVRATDIVGRWGGEEFLIVLPNTELLEGYQLIERVREIIAAEPIEVNGQTLNLSISCGICSTRFFSRFEDLIKAADISLYEAKSQGRNCTRPIMSDNDTIKGS